MNSFPAINDNDGEPHDGDGGVPAPETVSDSLLRSQPDSDGLQSCVRAFFSTTAFTPYSVREWKYSLREGNPKSHRGCRGATSGGFLEDTTRTDAPWGHNDSEAKMDRARTTSVPTPVTIELPSILPLSASPSPATGENRRPKPPRPAASAGSLRGCSHYRKIEDLSRFLHGDGIDADTYYFKDAMERRLEREEEAQSAACYGRQQVHSMDRADPRFCERMDPEASEAHRRAKALALPPRVTQFHQKFLETTALVRPYALGESHAYTTSASKAGLTGADMNRKALDTFVLTMQCQRPTKGVSAPY